MKKEFIKKILGKKGTELARQAKNFLEPNTLLVNKNGIVFHVNYKNNWFWKDYQNWEEQTFQILNKFLEKKYSYIDIGSWIGPTALYGCQLSRHCYAIEPNPVSFKELKKNVELNNHLKDKITLSNLCISDSKGKVKLFTSEKNLDIAGTSGSSILKKFNSKNFWTVEANTFSNFIQMLSITDCNFIKMDIEGAEFMILPTMLDYIQNEKPTLLIELHPMFVKNYPEKLKQISSIFECYDQIYNVNLKIIDIKQILEIDTSKTFHIVLSNKII